MLMVSGLRGAGRAPWITLADWAREPRSYALFFSVVGAVLFYIFLSGTLGFLLCGALMLTALLMITRGAGTIISSAAIAVVVTIVIHLVFAEMLRVPLPFGVIERWLV
jgi:putative tricarboxylic transport membrane protein